MRVGLICPRCGAQVETFRTPFPTVDLIIEVPHERPEGGGGPEPAPGLVLIRRKHPPEGWALPGGFVDYGETLEEAALREGREETGLEVELLRQFHAYSDPARDPRRHTLTVVFIARRRGGSLRASDDAAEVGVFSREDLPSPLPFDHGQILEDYFEGRY